VIPDVPWLAYDSVMGLDAQMLFRSTRRLRDDELAKLNHDLVRTLYQPLRLRGYEDQLKAAPIHHTAPDDTGIGPGENRIPPEHRPGEWYWVHIGGRYYGIGYEVGDIWGFIGVAEWIEFRIEGAQVWYGSDVDDFLSPFPKGLREQLAKHFFAVGHGEFANP
jgi:hypothetical protein